MRRRFAAVALATTILVSRARPAAQRVMTTTVHFVGASVWCTVAERLHQRPGPVQLSPPPGSTRAKPSDAAMRPPWFERRLLAACKTLASTSTSFSITALWDPSIGLASTQKRLPIGRRRRPLPGPCALCHCMRQSPRRAPAAAAAEREIEGEHNSKPAPSHQYRAGAALSRASIKESNG